jgi:catecholate siderophore receptor
MLPQRAPLDLDMAQQRIESYTPLRPATRFTGSPRALLAGTALALVLSCGKTTNASAQDTPIQLPPVSVEGAATSRDYKTDQSTLTKLPAPLRDTPQSIDIVPGQYIQDRGITNTSDALRAVPGVSLAAGEAGAQGNSLTLRGFSARNDIFLDGMRDFGSYYRDPFNYDEIEVLKGPSSILFGRGSTGGVVNQVSKAPLLGGFTAGSLAVGTDGTKRATVDADTPVPELGTGAAFRINGMVHDSQVAGRDVAESRRFGIAPSLAIGLGTPTRLTLSYIHQAEDDIPDYGLPFLLSSPAPVAQNNFYGFKSDYIRTEADIATAKIEHDVNDSVTIRNQLRYANYHRSVRVTEPQIPAGVTSLTPLNTITATRNEITVNSTETYLDNQTDVTLKFATAGIKHTVITGIELSRETSQPTRFTYTGVPGTNLVNPNEDQTFAGTPAVRSRVNTAAVSFGIYALDVIKLSEQWEFTGGIRFDRFDSSYNQVIAPAVAFSRVDEMPSYRTSLVYKPQRNGSIYVAWGTSFNPSAEALSLSAATANVAPEKNETYEIGSKWDLFADRLSVRGAIFRSEKTNARVTDPNNPLLNILGGDQRVDGLEIEAAGKITNEWQVYAGYSLMDSKVVKTSTAAGAPILGAPLTNVPQNTFNLWTTYDLTKRVEVGGGVNYVGKRLGRNSGQLSSVPDYYTVDLMARYSLTDNVDVQLNVTNLLDADYIDQVHPAHVVPGAGRTALFTTNFKF